MVRRFTAVVAAMVLATGVLSSWVKIQLAKPKGTDELKVGGDVGTLRLPDLEGKLIDVAEQARDRKAVLIAFWASWCGPCRIEMPRLIELHQTRAEDGFMVLSVNVDEDEADMNEYLAKHDLPFRVLRDPDRAVMKAWGLSALPSAVAIDSQGEVLDVLVGQEAQLLRFRLDGWLNPHKRSSSFSVGWSR